MEIEQIIFETGDQEVLLNANVVKGNFSYRSQLILNFTDLNLLLNKIQGQIGDNKEVSDLFETEKMYNGNLLYTLNFEKKLAQTIWLDSIEFNHEVKQIRA